MKEGQQHRHFCVHLRAAVMHIQMTSNPFTWAPHLHKCHNQSQLSLPTRFLHQLHAALPASARVLSVLEKLASVFTDVIIILTLMEGGNVNY